MKWLKFTGASDYMFLVELNIVPAGDHGAAANMSAALAIGIYKGEETPINPIRLWSG